MSWRWNVLTWQQETSCRPITDRTMGAHRKFFQGEKVLWDLASAEPIGIWELSSQGVQGQGVREHSPWSCKLWSICPSRERRKLRSSKYKSRQHPRRLPLIFPASREAQVPPCLCLWSPMDRTNTGHNTDPHRKRATSVRVERQLVLRPTVQFWIPWKIKVDIRVDGADVGDLVQSRVDVS